jgi:hypothetical protein
MSEQRAVPAGEARILLVASLFYGFTALTILVFAKGVLARDQASVIQLLGGLACAIAAFNLLKGSRLARSFLIVMSVFMTLGGVLFVSDFYTWDELVTGLLYGAGGLCSFYLLVWSRDFRAEFERRVSQSEAEKQRMYEELEREINAREG